MNSIESEVLPVWSNSKNSKSSILRFYEAIKTIFVLFLSFFNSFKVIPYDLNKIYAIANSCNIVYVQWEYFVAWVMWSMGVAVSKQAKIADSYLFIYFFVSFVNVNDLTTFPTVNCFGRFIKSSNMWGIH